VSLATRRHTRPVAFVAIALVVRSILVPDLPSAPASARTLAGPPRPQVSCAACIVVDEDGTVLYGRAVDSRRANASTTKMVTALIVVRDSDLTESVTVSDRAAATGRGGLDLQPGETFTVDDLLYALLLTSSNDAAVALAEHVAGSEPMFVVRMNRFVRRLGADNTHFVTAHGLDAPDHYSTARDLATIGARLLQSPPLARIVATPRTTIDGSGGPVPIDNRNLLLEAYRGAIGIKTGYTGLAGNVLVAAARRSGRTLIAVAMGSVDATADAAALLDLGWAKLRRAVLLPQGAGIGGIVWPFGGATGVVASAPVRGVADPRLLRVTFEAADFAERVDAGDPVGRIVVSVGARRIDTVSALASDTVTVDSTPWPAEIASSLLRAAARVTGRL
jgi:D-alanyl-D-alanine carboxypeptidase (penicillin-binding protein 5/6)